MEGAGGNSHTKMKGIIYTSENMNQTPKGESYTQYDRSCCVNIHLICNLVFIKDFQFGQRKRRNIRHTRSLNIVNSVPNLFLLGFFCFLLS